MLKTTFQRIILSLIIIICACATANAAERDSLKISIFGDSYSTFQGHLTPDTNYVWYFPESSPYTQKDNDVKKVEQTWWYQTIKALGAKLEINNSFSGSTVCYTGYKEKDNVHSNYSDRAFVTRSNSLGNPDIILICAATNDSWAGAQVGKYLYGNQTYEDLFFFRPAMAKMLCDIKQNYPNAKVLFMLNDILREDINESVHTICKHYGISCLDLQDIDKQSGHPSIKGMTEIANQVVKHLKATKMVK